MSYPSTYIVLKENALLYFYHGLSNKSTPLFIRCPFCGNAKFAENLESYAFAVITIQQPEKQMFGANAIVMHIAGHIISGFHHLF